MNDTKRTSRSAAPTGLLERLRRLDTTKKITALAMLALMGLGGFVVLGGGNNGPVEVAGDDDLFPELDGVGDPSFTPTSSEAESESAGELTATPEPSQAPVAVVASYPSNLPPEESEQQPSPAASPETSPRPVSAVQTASYEQERTPGSPAWLTGTIEPLDETATAAGPALNAPAGPALK